MNRKHIEERFGSVAERVSKFLGTPMFLLIQTLFMFIWIGTGIVLKVDPFPFIFLTLMLSVEAIYLGCFILVASTRGDAKHDAYEERDRLHREELAAASAQRERDMLDQLSVLLQRGENV